MSGKTQIWKNSKLLTIIFTPLVCFPHEQGDYSQTSRQEPLYEQNLLAIAEQINNKRWILVASVVNVGALVTITNLHKTCISWCEWNLLTMCLPVQSSVDGWGIHDHWIFLVVPSVRCNGCYGIDSWRQKKKRNKVACVAGAKRGGRGGGLGNARRERGTLHVSIGGQEVHA